MFLFLTDGEITEGMDGSDLLDYIKEQNTEEISATIFSYALGAEADLTMPKDISCQNNGDI